MKSAALYPRLQAGLAAVLFGASAPIAKLLLGQVEPIPLAALLYLGSGFGLLAFRLGQRTLGQIAAREAPLQRGDWPWLAGATLAGGVAAPIVLLFSLENTPAATASLLLNFEIVATTLIALLVFKEAISRRVVLAIGVITLASILVSNNSNGEWGISLAALGVLAACALWGIDNNLTRNISAQDPVAIAMFKGVGAGLFSLLLALVLGNRLPSVAVALSTMLIGILSYGLSTVLAFHWCDVPHVPGDVLTLGRRPRPYACAPGNCARALPHPYRRASCTQR
ncbi:MAG: DMT family transporter [Anaerolineae bacterium]